MSPKKGDHFQQRKWVFEPFSRGDLLSFFLVEYCPPCYFTLPVHFSSQTIDPRQFDDHWKNHPTEPAVRYDYRVVIHMFPPVVDPKIYGRKGGCGCHDWSCKGGGTVDVGGLVVLFFWLKFFFLGEVGSVRLFFWKITGKCFFVWGLFFFWQDCFW